jgi:Zn ribbon nucleic-acid-binding protein
MRLADGIRKHGFRKWYERELTQSHVRLFLLLLCTIGLLSSFELFSRKEPLADQLDNIVSLLLCAGIGIWALRRYLYLLMHAEAIASQAVCPACESYGRLQLVQDDERNERVKVKCRGCAHEWHIQDSGPG